jgi:hypothetical protein
MKKTLLASCVALVSATSQAELSPMSEFELHKVTGQAGVDIQLDVGLTIEEIRYTDTEEVIDGVSDGDGGSLVIENISLGGIDDRDTLLGQPTSDNGPNLDAITFAVDLLSNGDLRVFGEGSDGVTPVDIKLSTGNIYTTDSNGDRAVTLLDGLTMRAAAIALEMVVDGDTNDIAFSTEIGIEELDIDMSSLGIVIEDAVVAGSLYLDKIRGGRTPSPSDRVSKLYVVMDHNTTEGEVVFDFTQGFGDENIVDIAVPSISVGGEMLGAVTFDNLSLQGVSIAVSGHR